jgi:hypothetical protein
MMKTLFFFFVSCLTAFGQTNFLDALQNGWKGNGGGLTNLVTTGQSEWQVKTYQAATDPGVGRIMFNNTTWAAVTSIAMNEVDEGGANRRAGMGTMSVGDTIVSYETGHSDTQQGRYKITTTPVNNTGWWSFGVSNYSTVGAMPVNNNSAFVLFQTSATLLSANLDTWSALMPTAVVTGDMSTATNAIHSLSVHIYGDYTVTSADTNSFFTTNVTYFVHPDSSNIVFTMPRTFINSFCVINKGTNSIIITAAAGCTFPTYLTNNTTAYGTTLPNTYNGKSQSFTMENETNYTVWNTFRPLKNIIDNVVNNIPPLQQLSQGTYSYSNLVDKPVVTSGTNGSNGTNGLNGATGAQGIQGVQGIAGTNGLNGATGSQGIQGAAGINGTNGATGSQGIQGIQGVAGTNTLVTAADTFTATNGFASFATNFGSFSRNWTNTSGINLIVVLTNTPLAAIFNRRGSNVVPSRAATPTMTFYIPPLFWITNTGGGLFYAP